MELIKIVLYFIMAVFMFFSGYVFGISYAELKQKHLEDVIVECFAIIGKYIGVDEGEDDCK